MPIGESLHASGARASRAMTQVDVAVMLSEGAVARIVDGSTTKAGVGHLDCMLQVWL